MVSYARIHPSNPCTHGIHQSNPCTWYPPIKSMHTHGIHQSNSYHNRHIHIQFRVPFVEFHHGYVSSKDQWMYISLYIYLVFVFYTKNKTIMTRYPFHVFSDHTVDSMIYINYYIYMYNVPVAMEMKTTCNKRIGQLCSGGLHFHHNATYIYIDVYVSTEYHSVFGSFVIVHSFRS